jgi:Plasmid pRiA4b ORF-3-like protein
MQPHPLSPDIYQLRIVLRDISPLIWRRLLVRSDTTLAQLHLMLQILFDWGNEHLHHFGPTGGNVRWEAIAPQHVPFYISALALSLRQCPLEAL